MALNILQEFVEIYIVSNKEVKRKQKQTFTKLASIPES